MFGWFWEANVHEEPSFCPLAETRFGSRRTFGRRTCLGGQPFGCRSLPPKRDFRLWRALSAAEGATEPVWLSALEGLSAAEPAAKSALFSLPLHVFAWMF